MSNKPADKKGGFWSKFSNKSKKTDNSAAAPKSNKSSKSSTKNDKLAKQVAEAEARLKAQ